jgi:hypothetical protein
MMELARRAASPSGDIPFTEEEHDLYASLRGDPGWARELFNMMSATLTWTESNFTGCGLSILRAPIPLRSSTTPVLSISASAHPALRLPLPGMVPHMLVLTLNRTTIASLVLADFDDAFLNIEISVDEARSFNRQFVGQFAHFDHVRHLITGSHDLTADMTWAPYELVGGTKRKITFRRRD